MEKERKTRWLMVYLYGRTFTQTLTYLQSLFNNKRKVHNTLRENLGIITDY